MNIVNEEKNIGCPAKTVVKQPQISVTVMVEIPKGSRNKYEYDSKNNYIKYDRMLHSSVKYPSDYGFILDTLGDDGDPLDALILVWEPTFPGCIIEVKPIGMLDMWDDKGNDEKILCVPLYDPLWNHIEDLAGLPPHLLKEIENFFAIYKTLEDKKTGIRGWKGRKEAISNIKAAQKRFVHTKK